MAGVLIAVTDHAAERYAQRVRGTLDAKAEIVQRASRAWEAGRVEPGERGRTLVRDVRDAGLVYVCVHDVPRGELLVVTLWEEGDDARVPKRFTDALRRPLVTVILAAALAGCGGDDALSPEEYRAEMKRICTESDRQTNEVEQPTRATPEAIADYLTRLRDINAKAIARVEKLEPPEELKAAHDRALRSNRKGRETVDEVIDELESGGDPTTVLTEARKELEESSRVAKETAKAVGVPECGE
ncbi:MAG TPA: hypothetical protein VF549_11985 [Solirubrobacteraceae bacterium]